MWLIMFQANGSNQFVPQMLFYTEQQAKDWLNNMCYTVTGRYTYMYVPVANVNNFVEYIPYPQYRESHVYHLTD